MTSSKKDPSTQISDVLANTPRILALVWKAVPRLFLLSVLLTLAIAAIPPIELYVTKIVVDFVVKCVSTKSIDWHLFTLLLSFKLGLDFLSAGLGQIKFYVSFIVRDRCLLYAEKSVLEKAIQLDLAHYELPEFYDTLNRARSGGSNYPITILESLIELFGEIISFSGLLVLLLRFNWGMMLLLSIGILPTLLVRLKFSRMRFWMTRSQTQAGRMVNYLQGVMTENEFAKEIRLFNLGNYILQ